MPPEQLTGQRVDYHADLFALGCVAYEMLTGHALFTDGDITTVLTKRLEWSVPPAEQIRHGLSSDLYKFLCQTITVDPKHRIADLEEVSYHWSKGAISP
jgi:serine/threonine-protein kinase